MEKKTIMNPEEDAYGQEIYAYHNGERSFEVIERDDGYIDLGWSFGDYFSSYVEWSPHEQKSMEHVKGRVLDIGCGAGRHSLYLQERGFDVLGIDISPLAIKICKLRGVKKAEVMSIDDLDFQPNSFDTIIMMGNNFGLFGNYKKEKRLLKRFHKMTSNNALIIADTNDPYKTSNPAHLKYQEQNRKKGRMSGRLKLRVRFKQYVGKWFEYLLASKEEMEKILKGTGWKVKEYIDSENSRYIALIEKISKT
jgi:SAM-dependent methyltransferase